MRAMVIVIVTPSRDQLSGVAQVVEQVLVQALVPEAAIEAFHKAVLHGLAWRDVVPLDLPVFLPFQNGIRRQFGPIARREKALPRGYGHARSQAFPAEVVYDAEHPETAAIGQAC